MYWINYKPRHGFSRHFTQPTISTMSGREAVQPWQPRVDIHEEADRFVLHMDIPGVDAKSVEVEMHEGVLSIRGERRLPVAEASSSHLSERKGGSFARRFRLPESADAEQVRARSEHGVLEVVIPKSSPRRIAVTH